MTMFRCWRPDQGCTHVDGTTIDDDGASYAAERYVDENFSDWEYPDEVDVAVRNESNGDIEIYRVEVEHVPSFCAYLVKP